MRRRLLLLVLFVGTSILTASNPTLAQTTGEITGVVTDQANAIPLPGVPVEAVGTSQITYTDLDGRYTLELPGGEQQLKIALGVN